MSRPSRRAGLGAANLLVVAYLLAAAVALVTDLPGTVPTWLALHLLLLGAVTNAIVIWTAHFVTTLLQQPAPAPALAAARLVVLNVAILGVLVGVEQDRIAVTIVGAGLLVTTLLTHLGGLARRITAGRARRFAPTVRFYWGATAAATLGIAAGTALAAGPSSVTWWFRTYLVHVHLNLLGWVTLTVLGTQYTLWPTALRTRIVGGTEAAARRSLVVTTAGLTVTVAGLLAGSRALAAIGLLVYLVGVTDFLIPFVRTARQRAPHSPGTWMLAASTAWLAAGVVADVVALVRPGTEADVMTRVSAWVPWFVAGFVLQVLLGALSYLLPVVLGGPPAAGKRSAATLDRLGPARVLGLNAGVLLVASGGTVEARIGWVLVALAVVSFGALAAVAAAANRAAGRSRVTAN